MQGAVVQPIFRNRRRIRIPLSGKLPRKLHSSDERGLTEVEQRLRNRRRRGGRPCAGATPRPCCGPLPPAGEEGQQILCRRSPAEEPTRPCARSPTGMSPPALLLLWEQPPAGELACPLPWPPQATMNGFFRLRTKYKLFRQRERAACRRKAP
jgi:hypothetical protein